MRRSSVSRLRATNRALVNAKLSRVVLADFAQLTPERALMVTSRSIPAGYRAGGGLRTADQDHSQRPGPRHSHEQRPGLVGRSRLRRHTNGRGNADDADFILWSGSARHAGNGALEDGRYRLLITEEELYEADGALGQGLQFELGSSTPRPFPSTNHFSPRAPTP